MLARSLALVVSLALAGPAFADAPAEAAPAAAVAPDPPAAPSPEAPTDAPKDETVNARPVLVPRSNETMELSVSYLGITMGKVRLYVGRVDTTVAPVFLQAQTSSLASIVTLRQQLATYLDVATGLPRSASLEAVEGSYRHSDTVQFDRTANKATVRVKGKYDNTYVIDTPPGTIDFVGLVYTLRGLPLDPGARHDFPVLAGRHLKSVCAEVVGRETISTRIGDFRAVKVRVPTGFTGKFSEKNPTHIWFSDDDRRMVVRITSDFAIGHATATLVSYTPGAAPPPPALTAAPPAPAAGQ